MPRQLMEGGWKSYARDVLPEFTAAQQQELRRAFYAGAQYVIFEVILNLSPEADPTEDDLQLMKNLHTELNQFKNDVLAGKC